MRRNHRTTAAKVTAELNQHSNSTVSTRTVRRELNKAEYHGIGAIMKPLLSSACPCRDYKGWYADQRKQVIIILRRVHSFSFPNCRASLCVEAAHGSLQSCLLSSHNEVRRCISDGLCRHIVEFFRFHNRPAWYHQQQGLPEYFERSCSSNGPGIIL